MRAVTADQSSAHTAQSELESRALSYQALGPYPSSVPVDDALYRGETYARAQELTLPV
jgi:hypothetical protein